MQSAIYLQDNKTIAIQNEMILYHFASQGPYYVLWYHSMSCYMILWKTCLQFQHDFLKVNLLNAVQNIRHFLTDEAKVFKFRSGSQFHSMLKNEVFHRHSPVVSCYCYVTSSKWGWKRRYLLMLLLNCGIW